MLFGGVHPESLLRQLWPLPLSRIWVDLGQALVSDSTGNERIDPHYLLDIDFIILNREETQRRTE